MEGCPFKPLLALGKLETLFLAMGTHFLLVHGLCHGAWAWYKTKDLLQRDGHRATAIDNPGQGRDDTDPATITTLEQLASNVVKFFEALPEEEQVIVVAHSYGGTVAAYVSEHFPHKISATVYVSSFMFPSQDVEFVSKVLVPETRPLAELLRFGHDTFPTTAIFNSSDSLYNLSPTETVVLAESLLKPGAFLAFEELAMKHTPERYGSVPRVFIRLLQDATIPQVAQDWMIEKSPPALVLDIDTDHSPFFSTPQELHHHLLHIAETYHG